MEALLEEFFKSTCKIILKRGPNDHIAKIEAIYFFTNTCTIYAHYVQEYEARLVKHYESSLRTGWLNCSNDEILLLHVANTIRFPFEERPWKGRPAGHLGKSLLDLIGRLKVNVKNWPFLNMIQKLIKNWNRSAQRKMRPLICLCETKLGG